MIIRVNQGNNWVNIQISATYVPYTTRLFQEQALVFVAKLSLDDINWPINNPGDFSGSGRTLAEAIEDFMWNMNSLYPLDKK